MNDPKVADNRPMMVELSAGTHFWCACGRSGKQPYCDGSHQGTEHSPLKFEVDAPKKAALCMCKRTGNPPYCDGSHSKL